jgi:Asp-tRNA(Asn)/Glu-tRNA(Gln) amidotransferase A subunit family amidase
MGDLSRKRFLSSSVGVLATALVPSLSETQANPDAKEGLSLADAEGAAKTAGVNLTPEQLKPLLKDIQSTTDSFTALRELADDPFLVPATTFKVLTEPRGKAVKVALPKLNLKRPEKEEDLAFLSAAELSHLIRTRQITSVELTEIYLKRLKTYGPKLRCVITLTEELALKQAQQADQELRDGKSRGPLHGLPYGLKDLFAVPGYPTTWGAAPYKDRRIEVESAVYEKLKAAGAVLVAKLSMGALAQGDIWFGGRTESPWDPNIGSSGSSAGSGSATAAGLVAFAIGTETSGSIVSPSHNCRVTGLRPTFGSISRYGAMALSYSMDKIGPICRTAEDCALVFSELIGKDPRDPSTVTRGFNFRTGLDIQKLRIGAYVRPADASKPLVTSGVPAFEVLEKMGLKLTPVTMESGPPALSIILDAEAAAAFDGLTRSGHLDDLGRSGWPASFRESRLIPAVELVLADRARRKLQHQQEQVFSKWDVIASVNTGGRVYAWNLTGYPQVLVPLGQNAAGRPVSLSLLGPHFSEPTLLALAAKVQAFTGQTKLRPNMSQWG